MKVQLPSLAVLLAFAIHAGTAHADFDYYAASASQPKLVPADLTLLTPAKPDYEYYANFPDVADRSMVGADLSNASDVAAELDFASAEFANDTFLNSKDDDCCVRRETSLYGSIMFAGSFAHLRQGGFNTSGSFSNAGPSPLWQANENTLDMGGTLGVAIPRSIGSVDGTLRAEVQGMFHDLHDTTLASFPGFPGPVAFFYRTNMTDRWSAMGNLWYDIPLGCSNFEVYVGGGLGVAGGTMMTTDISNVRGSGGYSDLAWQVGCGLTYHYNQRLAIDLGYRFFDFGTGDVDLTRVDNNNPSGDLSMNVSAHQLTLAFRFKALQDFWPGR